MDFLPVGFCGALIAAASVTLFLEVSPYFVSGITVPAKIAAISSGQMRPGPSFDSQRMVLDDCYVAMNSLQLFAGPTSQRLRIAQQCASLAGGIADGAPTTAYAFLVGAVAAAALGDIAAMNADLGRSQRLAPREAWLAQARATLGEAQLENLDDSTRAGHTRDLGLLASSAKYGGAIVTRYLDDPQFRERLEVILGRLSDSEVRGFLSLADAALQARGS